MLIDPLFPALTLLHGRSYLKTEQFVICLNIELDQILKLVESVMSHTVPLHTSSTVELQRQSIGALCEFNLKVLHLNFAQLYFLLRSDREL